MLNQLCMPSLIYLIYSATHVMIDVYKENYNRAMIEFFISALFTVLLNLLCMEGLGIISWIIISIPFILMTTIASILLFAFQLDPTTGKPLYQLQNQVQTQTQDQDQTQYKCQDQTQYKCQDQSQYKCQDTKSQTHPSGYAYPIDTYYKIK